MPPPTKGEFYVRQLLAKWLSPRFPLPRVPPRFSPDFPCNPRHRPFSLRFVPHLSTRGGKYLKRVLKDGDGYGIG